MIKIITTNPFTKNDIINNTNALRSHSTLDKLNKIEANTLLISPSHDRLFPSSIMEIMQNKIPNSKLVFIKNAGHFAIITRAPELNDVIIKFLRDS